MKKVILAALMVVCSASLTWAIGTPEINWTVTVTNPTTMACRVSVAYSTGLGLTRRVENKTETIAASGFHSFDLGAKCPVNLIGTCYSDYDKAQVELKTVDMFGNPTNHEGSPACWNSTFKICRKKGGTSQHISKDDYSFCKN